MNKHLSGDQITDWLLGTRDECVGRHLEACDACSSEGEELRSTLSSFRDSLHAAAQHDQSFWRNQQFTIRERIFAKDWYPMHWAWAVAMIMVLITAVFLTRSPNSSQKCSSEDADKALLQEVQGDLAREVPEALAPAVLIAQERNEILAQNVMQQSAIVLEKRR